MQFSIITFAVWGMNAALKCQLSAVMTFECLCIHIWFTVFNKALNGQTVSLTDPMEDQPEGNKSPKEARKEVGCNIGLTRASSEKILNFAGWLGVGDLRQSFVAEDVRVSPGTYNPLNWTCRMQTLSNSSWKSLKRLILSPRVLSGILVAADCLVKCRTVGDAMDSSFHHERCRVLVLKGWHEHCLNSPAGNLYLSCLSWEASSMLLKLARKGQR